METPILPNMTPVIDMGQVSDGDRLFYELGFKLKINLGIKNNWIRTGIFKEIDNPKEYIKSDDRITNLEFLEHHNFMVIKN